MISVSEALSLILTNRLTYASEDTLLKDAVGRVCFEDVKAKLTMPPFDASAMDGYGIKFTDAQTEGRTLRVIGEAPAGKPFSGTVKSGEAVRIFTGSPMPEGTDHVVIQENVTRKDDEIRLNVSADMPRHIRKAGIDFAAGDTLISKGEIVSPAHIALAASGNHRCVPTHKRPRVAILASGDELRPPGSNLEPGQIVNSNMAALRALIAHWGGEAIDLGVAKDSLDSISNYIDIAPDADIIVPVGGASVGDYDFMKGAFASKGFETVFEKIAVRPGKPTWFAKRGSQRVLGLPGNPASAIVCAHLFLKPLLGTRPERHLVSARLLESLTANGPRETYLRARAHLGQDSVLEVIPFPKQDSSLITPLTRSNVLIKLPPDAGPWKDGDMIEVYPLGLGPDII